MLNDLLNQCLSLGPFPELNQPDCPKAKQDKLKKLITVNIPQEIESIINDNNFIVKGRVGQGKWSHVPWVGIHNRNINSDAQRGVYITILFNVQGDGFYLSLQHGSEFFTSYKDLTSRVDKCRKTIETEDSSFKKQLLEKLIPESRTYVSNNNQIVQYKSGSRPYKYTLSNIVGKEYSIDWLPSSSDLKRDLLYMLKIYSDWITLSIPIDNEESYQSYENLLEFESVEIWKPGERQTPKQLMPGTYAPIRSQKAGSKALQNASYFCEFNNEHTTFFVSNAIQYMEKHHLIPMKYYLDYNIDIDHPFNIYSLCPNCRKIIQYSKKKEIYQMVEHMYNLRKDIFLDIYGATLEKVKRFYS